MQSRTLVTILGLGLVALATPSWAADHPLIGRWEREQTFGGWVGPAWLEFDADTMRSDAFGTARIVDVLIERGMVSVQTRFGETYRFDVVAGDRICLPEATVHALDERRADDARFGDRICYARM